MGANVLEHTGETSGSPVTLFTHLLFAASQRHALRTSLLHLFWQRYAQNRAHLQPPSVLPPGHGRPVHLRPMLCWHMQRLLRLLQVVAVNRGVGVHWRGAMGLKSAGLEPQGGLT